ncbi:MAG: hypothetical protein ACTSXE_05015 [Candidatus Thorarchaeota archaeon]
MERDDREYRDESQGQEDQVTRNVIEPNEINRERLFSQERTRSRSSFPSNDEGLDGDKCMVATRGRTWKCEKVRGKWFRSEMGATTEQDPAENTAVEVVTKALNYYDKNVEVGVEEAPIDGNQYARKDAGWEEVIATGGGGYIEPDVQIDCGDWDLGTDCDIDCGSWD